MPFLVVASVFLGEHAQAALKEEGVGYLDLAGNFSLKQGKISVGRHCWDDGSHQSLAGAYYRPIGCL
jgi:hypothetical protein